MPSAEQQHEAVRQVFETAELLQMMLLDLPMYQLFVIQRTSKTVRDTIAGSIKLERKMWLRPEDDKSSDQAAIKLHNRNPLIDKSIFISKLIAQEGWAKGLVLTCISEVEELDFDALGYEGYAPGMVAITYETTFPKLVRTVSINGSSGILPSWKRMLAMKSQNSRFQARFSPCADGMNAHDICEGERWVRMGPLMEEIGAKYDAEVKGVGFEDSGSEVKDKQRVARAAEGQHGTVCIIDMDW